MSSQYHYFLEAIIKLSLSTLFSFIISFERELHTHPGGVCTHTLVGFGSCLFTMVSINLSEEYGNGESDPSRIAAQVVSGMGFLGSATIFKSDNYVKGINTAANLWISAAISMSIAADMWALGSTTAFFTLICLFANNRYKKYRYKKNDMNDINDNNHDDIQINNSPTGSLYHNRNLSTEAENAPYGYENPENE